MLKVFCPLAANTGRITIADAEVNYFYLKLLHHESKITKGLRDLQNVAGDLDAQIRQCNKKHFQWVCARVSQSRHEPEFPDPQVIFFEIQLSARTASAPALQKFCAFTPFLFKPLDKHMRRNMFNLFDFILYTVHNRHATVAFLLFGIIFIFSWLGFHAHFELL